MTAAIGGRCTTRHRAVVQASLAAMLALAAGACRSREPALLVFAAASTSGPLEEVGRAFAATAGDEVQFAFGATSELARQIQAGAPADVFLSADTAHMAALEKAGLVEEGAVVELLSNQLVVVVPAGSKRQLAGPADLATFDRIALADPTHVPLGIYARRWLEGTTFWDRVAPRVIPAVDARAALATVASGAAGAGIVYRTDAQTSAAVRIVYAVDRDQGPRIVYPVAPLARSRSRLARAFVSFLQGPQARAAFARAGFVVL